MKTNSGKINLIIQKITGLSKEQLFLNPSVAKKFEQEINKAVQRLETGEPLEYIIESAEFYGYNFFVDKRVLIPRDDTEIMVDQAKRKCQENDKVSIIDIGTGSGCIGISLTKECQNIDTCYIIDKEPKALEVANINVEKHKLKNRINSLQSNLLKCFLKDKKEIGKNNLIITANLPYIKDNDYTNVDKETRKFEPDTALYGGEKTGFELYEKLIQQCFELKKIYNIESISLFIEIGFDQYEISKAHLTNLGLKYEYYKDNGGIYRCIKINF